MRPFKATRDFADMVGMNRKLLAKSNPVEGAARIERSNTANVRFCQAGVVMDFTARRGGRAAVRLSSLAHLVGSVIGVRAKKEVCRSDAGPIVAMMTDKHGVRNW